MRELSGANMWRRNLLKPGSIKSKEVSLGYLLCIWLFICVLLEHKYWIPPIVLIPFLPPALHVWIFRIEWTMTGRKSWIMIMISFAHKTQRALNGHWTCKYRLAPVAPDSGSQPPVSGLGPLTTCVAAKNAGGETRHRAGSSLVWRRQELIWSRRGALTRDCLHYMLHSAVYSKGERIRKHFDIRHHISGGRRHCDRRQETLRRIQKRWPGENARHNSIHHPRAPAVSGSGCKLWWGHERLGCHGMLGCITLSRYPCLSVHRPLATG